MKAKIIFSIVIISLILLIDYLFFLLKFDFSQKSFKTIAYFLVVSLLIFLLLENFLYKQFFTLNSGKIQTSFFIAFPLILSMVVTDRLVAVNRLYHFVKTLAAQTSPNIWKFDPLLAHKAVPNTRGTYNYYIGDSITGSVPVIFDGNGLRTVPPELSLKSDTADLYLGCSFTFGDYILAENSYAYKSSKLLNHEYVNGAISAYGLGQMKLQLDSMLTKRKFKYVFLQLSPWLVERATNINGPTNYGYRPIPYYSDKDDSFTLNKLAFKADIYSMRLWRKSPYTYLDKLTFVFTDGRRMEIGDYFSYKIADYQTKLGLKPKPTKRKKELEGYFYTYAINQCKKYGAVPVILKLWYPDDNCRDLVNRLSSQAKVIDLDRDLNLKVKETGIEFKRLFSIYYVNGKDSTLIDSHPNNFANDLFSQKIYWELKK
jgi:hypothetical protein